VLAVRGETVILIDDGIATGPTVRAAGCAFERPTSRGSSLPCRPPPTPPTANCDRRWKLAVLMRSEPFYRVGASYEDFSQMSDEEVIDLLECARSCTASPHVAGVVETGGEE